MCIGMHKVYQCVLLASESRNVDNMQWRTCNNSDASVTIVANLGSPLCIELMKFPIRICILEECFSMFHSRKLHKRAMLRSVQIRSAMTTSYDASTHYI